MTATTKKQKKQKQPHHKETTEQADERKLEASEPDPEVKSEQLKFTGSDLVPGDREMPKAGFKKWFWCGTLPTCPNAFTHVGVCTFRAMSQNPTYHDGARTDAATVGGLMHLSKTEFMAIAESMSSLVVVFSEGPVKITVKGVDAMHQKRRRGQIVRILSDEELAVRAKNNNASSPYSRGPNDEHLADHLFMVACRNQENPATGDGAVDGPWPPPLSKTGIEWPSD